MKRLISLALILLPALSLQARKPEFDWNVNFDYIFNNCEFDASENLVQPSGTVNAARISPYGGLLIGKETNVHHRVMLGLDFARNFGAGENFPEMVGELQFFYRVDAAFRNGGLFTAAAGCFPQSWRRQRESGPFFDDTRLFFDPNAEGLLFRYDAPGLEAELGLDWMGKFGDIDHPNRRERFEIFTSGEWAFSRPLSLVWRGSFYHFAGSTNIVGGVVDNDLLELGFDFHPDTFLDRLDIKLSGLGSYQWDRRVEGGRPVLPIGLYSTQTFEKVHIGLRNDFYWGDDLMPLYEDRDCLDIPYGDALYRGMKCFHTRSDKAAVCDNITLYYAPEITDYLSVKVAFRFQFGTPVGEIPAFRGSQQIIALNLNLEALRPKPHNPSSRSFFFHYESL